MKWNLDSLREDNAGDGLILSPVNDEVKKIEALPIEIRRRSIFDPQYYFPKDRKGKLVTYPFFPANMIEGITTADFEEIAYESAQRCVRFQADNDFEYIVIPTRYFDELPSNPLEKLDALCVNPFCEAVRIVRPAKPVLLTVIAKHIQVVNSELRDELLNWITSKTDIDGVYLILERNTVSKQIKDSHFLSEALKIIYALKLNDLRVIVGYCNTEGLLYSIAGPDAITMGSYENLRMFGPKRFRNAEKRDGRGPSPRLYSGKLLQWIEYTYIHPIRELYSGWEELFEESPYNPLSSVPEFEWYFQNPGLYKHYFVVFSRQVRTLPSELHKRFSQVESMVKEALRLFKAIQDAGVYLDEDSDGSHLPHWLNAMALYRRYLEDIGL